MDPGSPLRLCALAAVLLAGCDAAFTDLRPASAPLALLDAGFVDAGFDDSGAAVVIEAQSLAEGRFSGRTGHVGRGGVALFRAESGALELRFSADFDSSPVPGPVIVLSDRETLGNRLEAEDREITTLRSARGAQTYVLPEAALESRFVWIFCKPFGVEIARAELVEVP